MCGGYDFFEGCSLPADQPRDERSVDEVRELIRARTDGHRRYGAEVDNTTQRALWWSAIFAELGMLPRRGVKLTTYRVYALALAGDKIKLCGLYSEDARRSIAETLLREYPRIKTESEPATIEGLLKLVTLVTGRRCRL